jgi:hypothetical protein
MERSIVAVAPALGSTPDALVKLLEDSGFTVSGVDVSLDDIADASGKSTGEMAAALLK